MKKAKPYGQLPVRKPLPAGKSGAGRGAGGKPSGQAPKGKPSKSGTAAKLALGVVTLCNTGLTLALHVMRRREILHAVRADEGAQVLLAEQKKTESLSPEKD